MLFERRPFGRSAQPKSLSSAVRVGAPLRRAESSLSFPMNSIDRMIISFSLKGLEPAGVGLQRLLIAAAGVAAFGFVLYRAPVWLDGWNIVAVVGAVTERCGRALILALGVAIRASAPVVKRVAMELSFFAFALIVAETILLGRAPERWSDDPLVQQIVLRERAARANGVAYDARLRADVVDDLRSRGLDAVPGFAGSSVAEPARSERDSRARDLASLERSECHGRGMQRGDRLPPVSLG